MNQKHLDFAKFMADRLGNVKPDNVTLDENVITIGPYSIQEDTNVGTGSKFYEVFFEFTTDEGRGDYTTVDQCRLFEDAVDALFNHAFQKRYESYVANYKESLFNFEG